MMMLVGIIFIVVWLLVTDYRLNKANKNLESMIVILKEIKIESQQTKLILKTIEQVSYNDPRN